MMERILFDNNWLFYRGDIENREPRDKGSMYSSAKTETMLWGPASRSYSASVQKFAQNQASCTDNWELVNLPHDYVITQTTDRQYNEALGFFKYENAWYRKSFNLSQDDKNKRIVLFFEGVATDCTVYINGCIVKHNYCGYNSFEIDATDFVKFGEAQNVLAVYVNTKHHEGWWYEGGGIYRHVWLEKSSPVSVDRWGVYVNPQKIDENTWQINLETTVRNDTYEDVSAECKTTVYDKDGKVFAKCGGELEVALREMNKVSYSVTVVNPLLWDIDEPNLYYAETELYVNGELADTNKTRFGFRAFGHDKKKALC